MDDSNNINIVNNDKNFKTSVKNEEELFRKLKGKFKRIHTPEDASKFLLRALIAMLKKDNVIINADSLEELYIKLYYRLSKTNCDLVSNLYWMIRSLRYFKSHNIDCKDIENGVMKLIKKHGYNSIDECFNDVRRKLKHCFVMRSALNILIIYFGYYATRMNMYSRSNDFIPKLKLIKQNEDNKNNTLENKK